MTIRTQKRNTLTNFKTSKRRRSGGGGGRNGRRAIILFLMCMAMTWILLFMGVVIWHVNKDPSKTSFAAASSQGNNKNHNRRPLFESIREKVALRNHVDNDALSEEQPGNDLEDNKKVKLTVGGTYDSPLVIFTCKRPQYLSDTLQDILQNILNFDQGQSLCHFGCPIIISEDGYHSDVDAVINEFRKKFQEINVPLYSIHHPQPAVKLRGKFAGYQALAQHYGWALTQIFQGKIDSRLPQANRVIILEEDIHISPDFFTYFEATSTILDEDPTLLAVSAYNDNGHLVSDPNRLLRSDFFPGLGWMMTRRLWVDELEAKWPSEFWDDWLREPDQRKGREVIRPEFSRTYHFGQKGGTSKNQFGSILERVKLSTEVVDWKKQDLSVLKEHEFNKQYGELIKKSTKIKHVRDATLTALDKSNLALHYDDFKDFQRMAKRLNIFDDEKATIPRTAYKGVVETRPFGTNLLFLCPPESDMIQAFPGAFQ